MLVAEVLNRLCYPVQVVAGDGGEKVVLDLSVQPARKPVVEQRRLDVSSRHYLQRNPKSVSAGSTKQNIR